MHYYTRLLYVEYLILIGQRSLLPPKQPLNLTTHMVHPGTASHVLMYPVTALSHNKFELVTNTIFHINASPVIHLCAAGSRLINGIMNIKSRWGPDQHPIGDID